MSAPIARLQGLSDEERIGLSVVLKKKLLFRALIFITTILVGVGVMVFFNQYDTSNSAGDNLEVINVVFVVIIVVCARFMFSEFMEHGKEIESPNKRVIRTKVLGRQGSKIILGNKSFGKEDILLDNSEFDSLNGGDEVVLELSAKSNLIFSVKKAL